MEEVKVGIVIISYNNELHIQDAIQSVIDQTHEHWICVIVDNGSTDSTFEIENEITKNDDRFSVFKKENEGPGSGRNYGYSKLPQDITYVHFLDGDDCLKPHYLEIKIKYFLQHPRVGLVGCHFEEIDFWGNHIRRKHRSRYAPSILFGIPRDLPKSIYKTPFVSFFSSTGIGPFGLYRKQVFEQTGGYELKSQEDTDMFCKMSLLSEVHYIDEHLYKKRVTGNNLAHQKSYLDTHYQFRQKWDFYKPRNREEQKIIDDAIFYYYVKHISIRDLKVGLKAFKEFLDTFAAKSLKWSIRCFKSGFKELCFKPSYHRIMRERENLGLQ